MTGLLTMLSYAFMRRALLVGILLALCAALLGAVLVLRRFSMLGDGLSHVGFGAMAAAAAANAAPLPFALPIVLVAAFLILRLSAKTKDSAAGDAVTAAVSSGAFAVGLLILSLSGGANFDVHSYMFGSVLSLSRTEALIAAPVCALMLILLILGGNELFSVAFDPDFALCAGRRADAVNTVLACATALIAVIGMKLVGVLLLSAMIVLPPLTAMNFGELGGKTSFTLVRFIACADALVTFAAGMLASYFAGGTNVPAGACIVTLQFAVFLVSVLAKRLRFRRG